MKFERRWLGLALTTIAALVACCTTTFASDPKTASPWETALYNPKPLPDDLVLPMPCGGRMVFRCVEIPGGKLLDDRRIALGAADERYAYKENTRFDHVAGSFPRTERKASCLYVAKYEVTELQRAALGDSCPEPSAAGRRPWLGVAWFDAVDFAHRYSAWLMANAAGELPKAGDELAFTRLPTEAEWEFAARGGAAVGDAEFGAPVFPMPEGDASSYAWHSGSSDGSPHPIGLLAPNPVGLHDVLGNASEIALEPFRLDRVGRLHGRAGGFVVRGGSFLTSEDELRTAMRFEVAHFDPRKKAPARRRDVGVRLVLAAPTITSMRELDELIEAWKELPRDGGVTSGAASNPEREPLKELEETTRRAADEETRRRLETVTQQLRVAATGRNENRDRAARALIRLGAFLGRKLYDDERRLQTLAREQAEKLREAESIHAELERAGREGGAKADATKLGSARARIDEFRRVSAVRTESARGVQRENLDYYSDTVMQVVTDFPQEVFGSQVDVLRAELESKKLSELVPYVERFAAHCGEFRRSGRPNPDAWSKDFIQSTSKTGETTR